MTLVLQKNEKVSVAIFVHYETHRLDVYCMQATLLKCVHLLQHIENVTIYCPNLLCSLKPKPPPQCTLPITKPSTTRSSPIPAQIINYKCKHSVLFRATSKTIVPSQFWWDMHWEEKKGGKRGLGKHTSQSKNWDMLESLSKKAPAWKDAPNAGSPITAQLHPPRDTQSRGGQRCYWTRLISSSSLGWAALLSAVSTTCLSILLL